MDKESQTLHALPDRLDDISEGMLAKNEPPQEGAVYYDSSSGQYLRLEAHLKQGSRQNMEHSYMWTAFDINGTYDKKRQDAPNLIGFSTDKVPKKMHKIKEGTLNLPSYGELAGEEDEVAATDAVDDAVDVRKDVGVGKLNVTEFKPRTLLGQIAPNLSRRLATIIRLIKEKGKK